MRDLAFESDAIRDDGARHGHVVWVAGKEATSSLKELRMNRRIIIEESHQRARVAHHRNPAVLLNGCAGLRQNDGDGELESRQKLGRRTVVMARDTQDDLRRNRSLRCEITQNVSQVFWSTS
jgi:hypothetical protein